MLISTHICHPALANDNLSGIVVATWLARRLARAPRRLSYRFLFVPGMVGRDDLAGAQRGGGWTGSATGWSWRCWGAPGASCTSAAAAATPTTDEVLEHALGESAEVRDFDPYGYDERQYCSPGFDLPVGRLTRTPHAEFPEYHTSADDLDLITPDALGGALETLTVDRRGHGGRRPLPEPEPQGRAPAGPARAVQQRRAAPARGDRELALLWVLSLLRRRALRCWTWPNAPGCPSRRVRAAADAFSNTSCWRRREAARGSAWRGAAARGRGPCPWRPDRRPGVQDRRVLPRRDRGRHACSWSAPDRAGAVRPAAVRRLQRLARGRRSAPWRCSPCGCWPPPRWSDSSARAMTEFDRVAALPDGAGLLRLASAHARTARWLRAGPGRGDGDHQPGRLRDADRARRLGRAAGAGAPSAGAIRSDTGTRLGMAARLRAGVLPAPDVQRPRVQGRCG